MQFSFWHGLIIGFILGVLSGIWVYKTKDRKTIPHSFELSAENLRQLLRKKKSH